MRPHFYWAVVSILSAQLIDPCRALLLDSGATIEAKSSQTKAESVRRDPLDHATARVADPSVQSESLVVADVAGSGITHGCRRTTDFFDQVCKSPLGSAQQSESQVPHEPLGPTVTADLLVCDLPEVEPLIRQGSDPQSSDRTPSATYAVSGTVVVRGPRLDAEPPVHPLPELGGASTANGGSSDQKAELPKSPLEPSYPGPDDEGFWRQREGKHEWHPAADLPGEVSGKGSDTNIRNNADTPTDDVPGTDGQDASHVRDYDAWSAEQEQGAFLSFNEWKERHAQGSPALAKSSPTNTRRQGAVTSEAQFASSHPVAAQQGTQADKDGPRSQFDSQQEFSSTLRPGPASSSVTDGAQTQVEPSAAVPKQQGAHQPDGSHPQQPDPQFFDALDPPVRRQADTSKIGVSVAPGDTSAQLSSLRHRWNFASLDCAAVVHRTNPGAKFASSILSEKKDRYMLSPCPQQGGKLTGGSQYVIVELCEEIKIDTIVLANYEFFSNMFKKFRVTAARQLTGRESDWKQLGVFRARNIRGQQVFRIPSAPLSEAFFRYVRIDFLEHFGSEYYCPVSLLRVYGITEMEEYKREVEELNDDEDSILEHAESAQALLEEGHTPATDSADAFPPSRQEPFVREPIREPASGLDTANVTAKDEDIWRKHEQAFQQRLQNQSITQDATEAEAQESGTPQLNNLPSRPQQQPEKAAHLPNQQIPSSDFDDFTEDVSNAQCDIDDGPTSSSEKNDKCRRPRSQSRPFYAIESARLREHSKQPSITEYSSTARLNETANTAATKSRPVSGIAEAERDADRARRASAQRSAGTSGASQSSSGSESIYRAIHRRLGALESNATLSHSYIEHSGKMLREVFARMEKRQESRMSDMLRALNASNWQQIESLKKRQHVDLQRAIFEFDVHRQQADTERRALLREVQVLAEEVLLEKRLSIAQLVLLLVVFVFVGLTRGSRTVPLLHSGFARIGRSSKRREAKTEAKLALPPTPRRDTALVEQSVDVKQPGDPPSRENLPKQARMAPQYDTGTGLELTPQRLRHGNDVANQAGKHRPVAQTPGGLGIAASPRTPAQCHPRSSVRVPVANGAGRTGPRGENLIGMLSQPRTRGRLVLLLETLDALDRAAHRRRSSKSLATRSVASRRKLSGKDATHATLLRAGQDGLASPALQNVRRAPRTQWSTLTYKQEPEYVIHRRHATPVRDAKAGHSKFDDLAGMSSDWTERSDNGEMSENAPYDSEEDRRGLRAIAPDSFSVEPLIRPGIDSSGAHAEATGLQPAPPIGLQSQVLPIPASADGATESRDHVGRTPQLGSDISAGMPALSSVARMNGHASSSESESEGGAWHRVLPRRTGNGSSLRRARQGTMDGKTQRPDSASKTGSRSEAPDRRGSPRPSSAPGPGFKPRGPGLAKLFRTKTPDYASPESPRNRRSGTPDTIRDMKPF